MIGVPLLEPRQDRGGVWDVLAVHVARRIGVLVGVETAATAIINVLWKQDQIVWRPRLSA